MGDAEEAGFALCVLENKWQLGRFDIQVRAQLERGYTPLRLEDCSAGSADDGRVMVAVMLVLVWISGAMDKTMTSDKRWKRR